MDPLSVCVSGLTIAGAIITTASSVRGFRTDYREAERQAHHATWQQAHLRSNHAQLNSLPVGVQRKIELAQSSIAEIAAALPADIKVKKKRDRLLWAAGRKHQVKDDIARLKETEISTNLSLTISSINEIAEIKEKISEVISDIAELKQVLRSDFGTFITLQGSLLPTQIHPLAAKVHQCDWLARYLGITAYLIMSRDYSYNKHSITIRWPLLWALVFMGRMSFYGFWPTSLSVSLRPQAIIPTGSELIEACKANDVQTLQTLFASGRAHPNDVTPDNLTPLRFAIRSGSYAAVRTLLDNGADPNLTFGKRETSPLDNAFLCGEARIIRLLLEKRADLEYVNSRTWTCLSYLWDPILKNHSTTIEIIDICASRGFNCWNYGDRAGWAAIHRAAAFGVDRHIKKLGSLGIPLDQQTLLTNWSPLQCAVRYGNMSTFKTLSENIPIAVLRRMSDSRGWGLIHLAASSGSVEMIVSVLEMGGDPTGLSDAASVLIPKELEYKELSARSIAEHYGHGQVYSDALKAASRTDNEVQRKDLP